MRTVNNNEGLIIIIRRRTQNHINDVQRPCPASAGGCDVSTHPSWSFLFFRLFPSWVATVDYPPTSSKESMLRATTSSFFSRSYRPSLCGLHRFLFDTSELEFPFLSPFPVMGRHSRLSTHFEQRIYASSNHFIFLLSLVPSVSLWSSPFSFP